MSSTCESGCLEEWCKQHPSPVFFPVKLSISAINLVGRHQDSDPAALLDHLWKVQPQQMKLSELGGMCERDVEMSRISQNSSTARPFKEAAKFDLQGVVKIPVTF